MVLARKAAQAASSTFKYQDQSSSEEDGEVEEVKDRRQEPGTSKQKPPLKNTYGGKNRGRNRANTHPVPRKTSASISPQRRNERKRPLSPKSPSRSLSALSSISPEPERRPTISTPTSFSRSPLKSSASIRDLLDGVLKRPSILQHKSSQPESVSSSSSAVPTVAAAPGPWSLSTIGSFVWVRIHPSGDPLEDGDDDVDTYWWPAEVISHKSLLPLNVKPFGKPTESADSPMTWTIELPSPSNVLPMMIPDSGFRFHLGNFMSSAHSDEPSPRKKTKTAHDLVERWSAAADAMTDADAQANGGLSARLSRFSAVVPEVPAAIEPARRKSIAKEEIIESPTETESESDEGSDFSESANPHKRRNSKAKPKVPKVKKQKAKAKQRSPSVEVVTNWEFGGSPAAEDEPFSDLENDDKDLMLDIPGELIYSRETTTKSAYWPAKILDYIPSASGRGKGKYRIIFFDGTEKNVPRSLFFTDLQEAFATCKAGEIQSEEQLDVHDNGESDLELDDFQRSASPTPRNPPPASTTFLKQDIHKQFTYVKPVLVAVMNGRYPASRRHQNFMHGGKARAQLTKDAGQKGLLTAKDVRHLTKILLRWALRDKAKAEIIQDDELRELENEDINNTPAPIDSDEFLLLAPSSDPPGPPSSFAAPNDTDHEMEDGTANAPVSVSTPKALDVEPAQPPAQTGSPEYERLSPREKLDYCTNVLVFEAVLQLLLWRVGKRTSCELLSDEEEATLHQTGMELIGTSDWVNEILQRRADKERTIALKSKPEPVALRTGTSRGTRTRPKRD